MSSGFPTNKGADQPALPHRLTITFVIRLLERIISKFTSEIPIFYLVSVAEETGLTLLCWKPRRQILSRRGPYSLKQLYGEKNETGALKLQIKKIE